LAFATKLLTSYDNLKDRLDYEQNLTFLGFLILENKLKNATKGTIKTLNECNIRSILATGDNLYTAISVGIEC